MATLQPRYDAGSSALSSSVSLPDVTGVGLPGLQPPAPPTPLLSSPRKAVATVTYNIDDDAWADTIDRTTGSVFYVDTPTSQLRADSPQPSSSSSSLSSISDLPPASLPSLPHFSPSLSERFTQALSLSEDSPSPEAQVRGPSMGSLRKRIKRAVVRRSKPHSFSAGDHSISASGSVPDLKTFYRYTSKRTSEHSLSPPSSPDKTPLAPHGAQYGSHGIPLPSSSPSASPRHDHTARTSVINVRINLAQYHLGREVGNPCSLERLGVVPTRSLSRSKFGSLTSLRFSFKSGYPPPPAVHRPVVVRGIAPTSPAAVTGQIHAGDTIMAVNGHSVDLENIDSVLAGLSYEIVFIIHQHRHRPRSHTLPVPPSHADGHTWSGRVRSLSSLLVGGRRVLDSHVDKLRKYPHILLYLTLDTNENDPQNQDILYQCPEGDSWWADKLSQLRGLFLTLSDIMRSLTGATSSCSTVFLDGKLIHFGYVQHEKEVLMLAMPASLVSRYQVGLLVGSVEELVKLLYGSLSRAFVTQNHGSLTHLFSLVFDRLLCSSGSSSLPVGGHPLFGFSLAPELRLPTDLHVRLDMALSQLDAADHCDRPEVLHVRRYFTPVGSCLFYKGALVCSHLPDREMNGVALFCHAYRLLELSACEAINQIVIWRELHLVDNDSSSDPTLYHEPRGRLFLLAVGMEHILLCMVVKQLSGSDTTTVTPDPDQALPTVDAVYIDRGRALILELSTQDLFSQCEERSALSAPLPAVSSADIALASLFTRRTSVSRLKRLSQQFTGDASDSDDMLGPPAHSQARSRGRSHTLLQVPFKQRKRLSEPVGPADNNYRGNARSTVKPVHSYMLTSGPDQLLLHYMSIDTARGLLLCPLHSTAPSTLQAHLLQCFRRASADVREVLRGRAGEVEEEESDSDDEEEEEEGRGRGRREPARLPFSRPVSMVIEHGVLFQCLPTQERAKASPTLNYWVVGRLFPEASRECYVCYQENVAQNVVEMAFRLLFGSAS